MTSRSPFGVGSAPALQTASGAVGLVETSTRFASSVAMHSEAEGHENPPNGTMAPTGAAVHVLAPPVGSVEVTTPPIPPPTHSDSVGHDTANGACVTPGVNVQADAPPVGLLDVITADPRSSPATHNDGEGQEMLDSHDWHGWLPLGSVHWAIAVSTWARPQAPEPPVGLVELTTLPAPSPATQSVADAHESVSSGP